MSKTILIAEQSEIIRKGLINLITGFDLFGSVHEVTCSPNIDASLIRINPDILLINPLFINPGLTEFLKGYRKNNLKVAGILYNLNNEELISYFDDVILVSDTRLKIRNKLCKLLNLASDRKFNKNDNTLSVREKDVVRLLAKGLSNKEISEKLFISPHTVTTHRKNISRKLNINSVAGIIIYAIINDIVSVEDMK